MRWRAFLNGRLHSSRSPWHLRPKRASFGNILPYSLGLYLRQPSDQRPRHMEVTQPLALYSAVEGLSAVLRKSAPAAPWVGFLGVRPVVSDLWAHGQTKPCRRLHVWQMHLAGQLAQLGFLVDPSQASEGGFTWISSGCYQAVASRITGATTTTISMA